MPDGLRNPTRSRDDASRFKQQVYASTRLPFHEAAEFLRRKTSIPTERWTDIWQAQHAAAFVVAGAVKDALLADLRQSVQSALDNGETLEDFRKSFDEAVAKHGWAHTGGRNWRSRVIFETNLRTAYAAGRYEQLKAVEKSRPFWRYTHGGSKKPRPEHLAWDGLILRADDPWWQTHYPPNGWGCSCKVFAVGARHLRRAGIDPDKLTDGQCVRIGADGKAALGAIPFKGETYEWTSKDGTRQETLPRGVQPGWAYNVGEAGSGEKRREDGIRAEMESQSPIPPGLSRDKRDDLVRAHLRSRAAAEKKAGAVITASKEKTRATGLIREVARKIPLTKLGFKPGEPPPDIRNIPEAAIDILNERLEKAGRQEKLRALPYKEKGGFRMSSLVLQPLASNGAQNSVVKRLQGLASYDDSPPSSAHAFELIHVQKSQGRPLTSLMAEKRLRRAFDEARNGRAMFFVGMDGNHYFEAVVDDAGGKALFLFERGQRSGVPIHWYPVKGSHVFILTDREREAVVKLREQVKTLSPKRALTDAEIETIVSNINAPATEQRNLTALLKQVRDEFI